MALLVTLMTRRTAHLARNSCARLICATAFSVAGRNALISFWSPDVVQLIQRHRTDPLAESQKSRRLIGSPRDSRDEVEVSFHVWQKMKSHETNASIGAREAEPLDTIVG